ncbi:MAG: hypothetical protein RXO36_07575 [Candidatus Nanopusillus acidilobi]
MRKNIVMPKFMIEAVKDMQEALNLYLEDYSTNKKIKNYSFSRVICHLISEGIEREFELTKNTDKDFWRIKENFERFKQLIAEAYLKSQEFNIDKPHRKKRTQININKDQNQDKDIDIEDTDIDQDIDLDIDQSIDLDKDLGLDQDIDQDIDLDKDFDLLDKDIDQNQDQDFNPDQDFDQDFD